jgi:hypothetical protein
LQKDQIAQAETNHTMAEVLVEFPEVVAGENGAKYRARACGAEAPDGLWQGWIEFEPINGGNETPVRSPRETTQPNRTDTHYWATGLSPIYLEGALRRALHPLEVRPSPAPRPPLFDAPAPGPGPASPGSDAVLNPFSVYQKGEALLRRQLAAFSSWHLVNIVNAHQIPTNGHDPNRLPPSALIDAIVQGVKRRLETASSTK